MSNALTLGARLRELRAARRLTQQEVAEEVGISRSTLASIEAGHDLPGRETLFAMSRFYRVSGDDLKFGAQPPGAPEATEVIEDPDERALVRFWRGLTHQQRILFTNMIAAAGNHSTNPGAAPTASPGARRQS